MPYLALRLDHVADYFISIVAVLLNQSDQHVLRPPFKHEMLQGIRSPVNILNARDADSKPFTALYGKAYDGRGGKPRMEMAETFSRGKVIEARVFRI